MKVEIPLQPVQSIWHAAAAAAAASIACSHLACYQELPFPLGSRHRSCSCNAAAARIWLSVDQSWVHGRGQRQGNSSRDSTCRAFHGDVTHSLLNLFLPDNDGSMMTVHAWMPALELGRRPPRQTKTDERERERAVAKRDGSPKRKHSQSQIEN